MQPYIGNLKNTHISDHRRVHTSELSIHQNVSYPYWNAFHTSELQCMDGPYNGNLMYGPSSDVWLRFQALGCHFLLSLHHSYANKPECACQLENFLLDAHKHAFCRKDCHANGNLPLVKVVFPNHCSVDQTYANRVE